MSTSSIALVVSAILLGATFVGCSTSPDEARRPASDATTPDLDGAEIDAAAVAWVRPLSGPTNEDDIDGVAAAPDGSAYVTGKFEQTVELAGATMTSEGLADIPIARFGADGEPVWVQRFGGPGEDNLFDIDADAAGAVATGIFQGTVDFGDVTLTAAGASDCVVVALDAAGDTRWARAFGGPGPDGCNEVVIGEDGSVVTSVDTAGGWDSPDGRLDAGGRDTLLVQLDPNGSLAWARRVGGPGAQRGKSLAVAEDGSIAFGGDTVGPVEIAGRSHDPRGSGKDGWLGRWSAEGELGWVGTWGGPDDDLVKGLAFGADGIYAVGPFTGTLALGSTALGAEAWSDTAIVRYRLDGSVDWAASISATNALVGAEITSAADGGIWFGGPAAPGLAIGSATGAVRELDDGGSAWLVHYRPDGTVGSAHAIEGTDDARPGELDRAEDRIYLDISIRGIQRAPSGEVVADGKDSSLWALDLVAGDP